MYKVFFNQKSIVLTVPENITLFKTYPVYAESFSGEELKQWFYDFDENDKLEAILVHPNPIVFFQFFQYFATSGILLPKPKAFELMRKMGAA